MYTHQQAVDALYLAFHPDHLGLPLSRDHESGHCFYAGPTGTGCALGIFLPRDLARRLDGDKMRSPGARHIVGLNPPRSFSPTQQAAVEQAKGFLGPHRYWIRLQRLHDRASSPMAFVNGIRDHARDHALEDPARAANAGAPTDDALAALLGDALAFCDNLIPA